MSDVQFTPGERVTATFKQTGEREGTVLDRLVTEGTVVVEWDTSISEDDRVWTMYPDALTPADIQRGDGC